MFSETNYKITTMEQNKKHKKVRIISHLYIYQHWCSDFLLFYLNLESNYLIKYFLPKIFDSGLFSERGVTYKNNKNSKCFRNFWFFILPIKSK